MILLSAYIKYYYYCYALYVENLSGVHLFYCQAVRSMMGSSIFAALLLWSVFMTNLYIIMIINTKSKGITVMAVSVVRVSRLKCH